MDTDEPNVPDKCAQGTLNNVCAGRGVSSVGALSL